MAIAFDATSASSAPATPNWSHTCTGSNLALVVFINANSGSTPTVTYNSVGMTQIGSMTTIGSPFGQWAYILIAPATGANSIVVSGATNFRQGVAVSYTGCKQTGQPDATASTDSGGGSASSLSNAITTIAANSWIIACFANNSNSWNSPTNVTNLRQTNYNTGGFLITLGDQPTTTAGAVTQTIAISGGSGVMGMNQVSLSPALVVSLAPLPYMVKQAIKRASTY